MNSETKEPLVSVIMPCYKMGRFIGEALESVGKQTYTNWEVIAVDDCGPEDGTKEAVESFNKNFPNHRIIYHRHKKNGGVSAARNTAIGIAQGEYLAFLDPDDIWESDHLDLHAGSHLQLKDVCMLTSSRVRFVEHGTHQDCGQLFPDEFEIATFPLCLSVRNPINPSGVMIRRRDVVDAGYFNICIDLQHVEDWDLWIRLVQNNTRFHFLKSFTVAGRKHQSNATNDQVKMATRICALEATHPEFFKVMKMYYIEKLQSRIRSLEARIDDLQDIVLSNPIHKVGYRLNRLFLLFRRQPV